jgi:hypothetical protein
MKSENENKAKKLMEWLKAKRIAYGVRIYSRDAWKLYSVKAEMENYGENAIFIMVVEGSDLGIALNHPSGPLDHQIAKAFNAKVESLGLYYEFGSSIDLNFYPDEQPWVLR